jgi:hypothetical protein
MDGILTVVRACPKTQLDYSNYISTFKHDEIILPARWIRDLIGNTLSYKPSFDLEEIIVIPLENFLLQYG